LVGHPVEAEDLSVIVQRPFDLAGRQQLGCLLGGVAVGTFPGDCDKGDVVSVFPGDLIYDG
jgi:hypothetical protein